MYYFSAPLEPINVPLLSPEHAVIATSIGMAHATDFIVTIAVLFKMHSSEITLFNINGQLTPIYWSVQH